MIPARTDIPFAPNGTGIKTELNRSSGPARNSLPRWRWRRESKDTLAQSGSRRTRTPDRALFAEAVIFLCAVSLQVGVPPLMAQGREFQIYKHRSVVLKNYDLSEVTSTPTEIPMYTVLVQKTPYIEIHLEKAVPVDGLKKGPIRAHCVEVGVFKDRLSRQTWTIGKACRLF